MAFTGTEDQFITLADGSTMTKNYRNTLSSAADTIAHYFSKDTINGLLNQTDCVGIRIYYALDSVGHKQLVACGVYANGNDIYTGLIADKSICCPTNCSSANPLNS